MKTTKKGFTLIELMVVIVIIGILAAIAIPKLFGMTAKAKAAEIGPASGTWSKLQQAFLMEKTGYGSWAAIAYRAPGAASAGTEGSTGYFHYTGAADGINAYTESATRTTIVTTAAWYATNIAVLGDCTGGSGAWTASFADVTNDNPEATNATVTECGGLTPNFENLR